MSSKFSFHFRLGWYIVDTPIYRKMNAINWPAYKFSDCGNSLLYIDTNVLFICPLEVYDEIN